MQPDWISDTGWQDRTVLVVSPTPTHPQDYGNRKRIFRICQMLRERGAKIHFIHYVSEAEWRTALPVADQADMMAAWDGYYPVPPSHDLHGAATAKHHTIDEWWDPKIDEMIRWLTSKHSFDAVLVNYTWLSKAFEFVPASALKILDTHDKFSGRKELLASYGIAPEFFYLTEKEEAKGLARADVIWAIKGEEKAQFEALTEREVIVVPHGDPAAPLPVRTGRIDEAELRLGVMGAKNSINVKNLMRFLDVARDVFRTHLPPLKIVVGGTVCELIEHMNLPFVELLGWVDDVEDFYTQIDVALVPMEFSTGLKIKTSEAMTFGVPIISHVHAFEGYQAFHPAQQLASFEDMARYCTDLAFEGPEALAPLRDATRKSHAQVLRSAQLGVAQTGARIAKHGDWTLVCLSDQATKRQSLQQKLALSYLEVLRARGPVAIFVQGFHSATDLEHFARALPLCPIYLCPEAQSGLSAREQQRIAQVGALWLRFDQVCARLNLRRLWLETLPDLSTHVPDCDLEQLYINLPMMAPKDADMLMQTSLAPLIGPFTTATVLGESDSVQASHLRQRFGAQSLSIAPFYLAGFHDIRQLTPPPRKNRYGVNVIIDSASPAILNAISDVAALSRQALINVIQLDGDWDTVKRRYGKGVDTRMLSPSGLNRTGLGLLRSAAVTVNLSTGVGLSRVLVSCFDAAGHDVIDVGARQGEDNAYDLLSFMQDLHARLSDKSDAPKEGPRFATLSLRDPGWGRIWT
ncbi:MAG: glycosyltransferase [Sedimentitalea sp.]